MKQVVKIHTNSKQRANSSNAKSVKTTAEWQSVFVDFSKVLIVIIVAVILIGFYTYINSEIDRTAKDITKLELDIKNIDREIENYEISIIELKSWKNINQQIARFNMQLQLPQAQQRVNVTLLTREQLESPLAINNQDEEKNLTKTITMK